MNQSSMIKSLLPWMEAMTGGLLAFLGYAGFDWFFVEWISLIPILWAIRHQRPARAFFLGWIAGIIGHGGGFYWIIHMFEQFAGMPLIPSLAGLILLAAANGIIFAVWAWATRLIICKTGWSVVWVSPVIWTALEKFWPQIFPNYLGASQYKLIALTQIADITGILGVTFLIVYINSFIYAVIEKRIEKQKASGPAVVIFAVVISAVLIYGTVRIHTVDQDVAAAEKLKVGLVQINRGAGEKHEDRTRFLREHLEMSGKLLASNKLDLLVWPENVFTFEIESREGSIPPFISSYLDTPLLSGTILRILQKDEPRYYNSAVMTDRNGKITGTYDKTVLVPFGEYIPLGETFPWLYSWSPYSSRFWSGKNTEPMSLGSHPVSVNICYEDIFPGHVRLLMEGGRDHRVPEAMINLTDDSWYGDTVEPMEHLVLASFRAIEHRRSLVRSTTTGISAIVDPVGRLDHRTGQWTRETLVGLIPMMKGRTIYALMGDWMGWLCAFIALICIGRTCQISLRFLKEAGQRQYKVKKGDKSLKKPDPPPGSECLL